MRKIKILILLFIAVLCLSACGIRNINSRPSKTDLQSISSYKELEKLLQERKPNYDLFAFSNALKDDSVSVPNTESTTPRVEDDYTKTNVQVEGIDELDIVKSDGSRIYSVYNDQLSVVEVDCGMMQIVLSNNLNQDKGEDYYYSRHYIGLYLSEKYFITIYHDYEIYSFVSKKSEDAKEKEPYYYSVSQTCVDIYDKKTLEKIEEYKIKGDLNTSRLINEQLYLLVMDYPDSYLDDIRPWYFENGKKTIIPVEEIKYIENMNYNQFTTLFRIDLKNEIKLDYNCLLGPSYWQNVYVSHNGIYLSNYQYFYPLLRLYSQKSIVISFVFDDDGSVYYGGSANFEGTILDQFSMDEYNGYFRLVTTEGWGEQVKNRLYIFERQIVDEKYSLVEVGKIDQGLGKPGERVKSARFNGDQATVVTFLEIDPLYVIDLSDVKKPKIVGELEVPGYSTYQHPWLDKYLIGIGYQVESNRIVGIKLSLFDISDPENPLEVGKSLVLDNGAYSYSEALYNHKAILIDEVRGYIGFAVATYNWRYAYYTRLNEYILFTVDPLADQPITINKTINHFELAGSPSIAKDMYYYFWCNSYEINRAIRIGDYLYAVGGSIVSSHNLNNSDELAKVLNLK